ncbi:MAG TPA: SCO family protein [Nocardioidaceae bacterium]|nr:SCO family protein [Nocardioidaceae bacterium]
MSGSSGSWRRRVSLAVLLPLVLGAPILAGCGSSPPPAPGNKVGTQLDGAVKASILSTPLVDWRGKGTTLSAYAGKVLVISDAMTLCQETCPLNTANVVAAARKVARAGLGDRVRFVSITVDPQRDTPAQLAAYRRLFTARSGLPDWTLLTGSPADIDRLWSYLGVYRKKVPEPKPAAVNWRTGQPLTYDVQHSDELFFFDSRQHERFVISGMGNVTSTKLVPRQLRSFLSAQGERNLAHPPAESWTVPQVLQVVSWLTGDRVS